MRFFTFNERPDLAERYSDEAEEFWPPVLTRERS